MRDQLVNRIFHRSPSFVFNIFRCAGNLTAGPCGSNAECEGIDSNMDSVQLCGCTQGLEPIVEVFLVPAKHPSLWCFSWRLCRFSTFFSSVYLASAWQAREGKRCCADFSVACSSDAECQSILEHSFCGCVPGYPLCGPFFPAGETLRAGGTENPLLGRPCLFRGANACPLNPDPERGVEIAGDDPGCICADCSLALAQSDLVSTIGETGLFSDRR